MAVNFTPDLKPYSGQGKFRYWVQMVLPTIYDDSLSYMELLNKVVYVINLAIEDVDAVEENVSALLEAFNNLQKFTNDYFDNLDVQEEIDNKLDEMVSDGTFATILQPLIQNYQVQLNLLQERVDNLSETITPGSTTGDAELIDIRVAYDGKTYTTAGNSVRTQIQNIVSTLKDSNAYNYVRNLNLNSVVDGGVSYNWGIEGDCNIVGTAERVTFANLYISGNSLPDGFEAGETYYVQMNSQNVIFRIYDYSNSTIGSELLFYRNRSDWAEFTIPESCTGLIIRFWVASGQTVNETLHPIITKSYTNKRIVDTLDNYQENVGTLRGDTLDDYTTNLTGFIGSSAGQPTVLDAPIFPAWLNVTNTDSMVLQIMYPYDNTKNVIYRVKNINGVWSSWNTLVAMGDYQKNVGVIRGDTLDDFTTNLIGFISSSGGQPTVLDAPIFPAWLNVTNTDGLVLQILYPYDNTKNVIYRVKNISDAWSSWNTLVAGGETTTIVQEVSRDTYNNEYNINVTPQITTDSDYWLQPVDTESADETNKTDMTSAIIAMLNTNGYCKLAPGIFYVSGNIDMPAGSTLEGCGKKTIIRLLQSAGDNYIIRMHTKSTLKNVCLSGSYNPLDILSVSIGGRNGVQYIGNRDGESPTITPRTCTNCMIEGCYFENLDSGIYGYNAGGGVQEGLMVNDCYFERCKVGINIDYWAEYCKFTNCVMYYCHYACINNGGNNTFTACTFHGVEGFIIDNSDDNKPNIGHGTLNGCTINHIDNINHPDTLGGGLGIKIINTSNGFVISNCQLWYSKVYVERSSGVLISGCEFGGNTPELEITGTDYTFIDGCIFKAQPQKTFTAPVRITNSYAFDGTSV